MIGELRQRRAQTMWMSEKSIREAFDTAPLHDGFWLVGCAWGFLLSQCM